MIAEHLGVRLQFLEVKVDAHCDVRGCLLVEHTVPVGFQRMRSTVRLQTRDRIEKESIKKLIAAAERTCVVMQTLRNGVPVQTRLENIEPAAAANGQLDCAGASGTGKS